ncbi:hypothetical protein [Flavobacterium okayamense]|uniref:Uncharacterized protein n=1 Tax=Flavobacterium okayamense TaxID=2830782 RepID=A0ABM7S2B7_9FLAO|nr:hypothetical protein [Flavobacterium okayamense]BCY27752.1 hypothetical protein KK2020170_06200 [Flavobacterium okayamense]
MKNSTVLFGLVILITLLSMISKEVMKQPKNEIYFEKEFKTVNSSIHSGEQLPIISIKRD